MAFKMKGYSGNHGKSPAKNYKKGYYGDSPAKKTYKEAYKSRDMKTYGSMSEAEYTAEAKRQSKSYKETGKWDVPKKASSPKVTTPKASKPKSVKAEANISKPTKTVRSEKQVKKDTRKSAKATRVANRLKKKDAKKQAMAKAPGTSKLEKRLNVAGAKARARKAKRKSKK